MAAIEALIVMFAIINDAYLAVDDEDEEEKKIASVGQRDLFELENAISSLADRSGNDKELRALQNDVEQLMRVVRSLRPMSEISAGEVAALFNALPFRPTPTYLASFSTGRR